MGVLVEAGDERIWRHALSCGLTWFDDGAQTEKEKERAQTKHRGLLYQDAKAGERFDATARHGSDKMRSVAAG